MRTFIMVAIATMVVFLLYKSMLVTTCKLLKAGRERKMKFDLFMSIAMQVFFWGTWVICMNVMGKQYGLSDVIFYISFCLMGAFCVIWCYFSWDVEHIFTKPCVASQESRKIKKIVIYALMLLFVLCQGYFKVMNAIDSTIEVNVLFSVTDSSIVITVIALDRLLNQIFSS